MNWMLDSPPAPAAAAGMEFNVVIACEDSATAVPAYEVLRLVESTLPAAERLIYRWWTFEVLAVKSLRLLASQEAAIADLIMIAAHDGRELPMAVSEWTKQWVDRRRDQSGALVVLLDAEHKKSAAAQGMLPQLKRTAELARMNFFATQAKEDTLGTVEMRRNLEAARRFVMACTNRGALRIVGRKGAKCAIHAPKTNRIER